jgi:hypothetical protein
MTPTAQDLQSAATSSIHILGDVSTPTVDMVTVKLHLNSVISTKGARYCTIDPKDFYLNTPMVHPKYMRMKLKDIPPEFVKIYDIEKIAAPDGTIYVKIQKGMCGLPQAGILSQNLLKERLNKHGYHQSPTKPGLWRQDWRPISFTLCVDNFDIKYIDKEHTDHPAKILNKHYVCSINWTGTRYIRMNMD